MQFLLHGLRESTVVVSYKEYAPVGRRQKLDRSRERVQTPREQADSVKPFRTDLRGPWKLVSVLSKTQAPAIAR
jgi:hypothetical protein